METPAAVVKELCLWNGNSLFADLCNLKAEDLIGMGIERIVHPESLGMLLANFKERDLGNLTVQEQYNIFLKNEKQEVEMLIHPLREPVGASLLVLERSL